MCIPLASLVEDGEVFIGKTYDIDEESHSFLPLTYPEDVLAKSESLGGLAFPNIQEYDGILVYNFPCSSSVYVYDIASERLNVLELNSITIKNSLGDKIDGNMSPRKRFEAESMSARFDKVYYSSRLCRFYRIHYGEKENLFDKNDKVYLMSCDMEGKNVREYRLPFSASQQYIMYDDIIYYALENKVENVFLYAKIDLKAL